MKQIFRYIRPFTGKIAVGLLIKTTGTLMDLALPWMLAAMLDTVAPSGNKGSILFLGLMMVLAACIGISGNVIANRIASAVARDTTRTLRSDLFAKCMSLSCSQVEHFGIPSLETRLTGDTYNIHQTVGMMQRMGVRAPILLIGGLCFSFAMEARLALIMTAVLPLLGTGVYLISRFGRRLYVRAQAAADSMVRKVRQVCKGIRVIKAFSSQKNESEAFEALNLGLSRAEQKAVLTMSASNPVMTVLLNLGLTAVILTGAFLVHGGVSTAGKIIAFMSYFTIISNAMLTVTRIFTMYSKCAASAQRISEVMDMQPGLPVCGKSDIRDDCAVSFSNVSFSYGSAKILDNISFSLKKGGCLGIVGATGSGKSTMLKLCERLYDPCQGEIRVMGRDVRSYTAPQLHALFAQVLQNDFIFSGTVRENICFGRDIPDDELISALKKAHAEFVLADPEGLDRILTSKGTNISGGQKQRLLIARAIAAAPPILILDDAASALDYRTDAAIRRELADIPCTKIIATQRVSSVMQADCIIVLDNGRIAASGTHEELLARCPLYREISLSQIGGAALE